MKTTSKQTLTYLQALRAIASMLVVLMHAGETLRETTGHIFLGNIFYSGGSGVDIFFVLSGFIITHSSWHQTSDPGELPVYLRRRFVRIYPVYWVIFLLFISVHLLLPQYYSTHDILQPRELASSLLLLPGHTMVNGVSWTMTYEIFFYLLFCLFFLVRDKKLILGLLGIYSLLIVIISLTGLITEDKGNPWLQLIVFPMNIEFFMGICIGFLWKKIPIRLAVFLLVAGLLLFISAAAILTNGIWLINSSLNRVVSFGIPSAMIIAALVKLEQSVRIARVPRWVLALGDASYSLYLLHLPILIAGIRIISSAKTNGSIVWQLLTIFLVAAIAAGSVLFYRLVEGPLINKLNALLRKKRNTGPAKKLSAKW